MAKISKHGGVSDVLVPKDDAEPGVSRGGPPVLPGPDFREPREAVLPEDVPGAPEDEADESPSGDDLPPDAGGNPAPPVLEPPVPPAPPDLELPPANALKSVWEDTLLGAGVAHDWVYAEGRTKDQLIETGRGIVDGSVTVDPGGQPTTDL